MSARAALRSIAHSARRVARLPTDRRWTRRMLLAVSRCTRIAAEPDVRDTPSRVRRNYPLLRSLQSAERVADWINEP